MLIARPFSLLVFVYCVIYALMFGDFTRLIKYILIETIF